MAEEKRKAEPRTLLRLRGDSAKVPKRWSDAPPPALCLGELAQMAEVSLGGDVGLCPATLLCSHREDGDSAQTCQD